MHRKTASYNGHCNNSFDLEFHLGYREKFLYAGKKMKLTWVESNIFLFDLFFSFRYSENLTLYADNVMWIVES